MFSLPALLYIYPAKMWCRDFAECNSSLLPGLRKIWRPVHSTVLLICLMVPDLAFRVQCVPHSAKSFQTSLLLQGLRTHLPDGAWSSLRCAICATLSEEFPNVSFVIHSMWALHFKRPAKARDFTNQSDCEMHQVLFQPYCSTHQAVIIPYVRCGTVRQTRNLFCATLMLICFESAATNLNGR